MFERFTERARRTVFSARYEAAHLGMPHIDTEHLLLGILREDNALIRQVLPKVDYESVHRDVAARVKDNKPAANVNADLPLTEDAKRALKYSMEESDQLNSRHISTEHLLLGLVRDRKFESAKLLSQFGAELESLRKRVAALGERTGAPEHLRELRRAPIPRPNTVEIHGKKWAVEWVKAVASRLREHAWYWERKQWQARDVVYEKNGNRFSCDTSLAQDASKFLLVKSGWKKDNCAICHWELLESDDATRGVGFTNGKDWVCEECYYKFITGEFFSSSYSDIT